MKAMVLDRPGERLRLAELPMPEPGAGQVLVKVRACAVCRTDLHVVDGERFEVHLVDVLTLQGGKIAAKRSYRKGRL